MNRSVLARQMFAKGGAAFPDLSGDGKITQKDILMGRGVPMQEGGDPQMAQRQMENIDALRALRSRAQAQAMGANQYGVPLTGLDDVSRADASKAEDFDPNNIYNIARFFRNNPGTKVSDYNRYFRTNLNPEEFEIFETEAEPVGMAMGGDPAMAQGVGSMMPPPPVMPEGQGMAEQVMDPQVLENVLSEAQNQITDLDEAEDYETVINSIRGEEAPIEERYEELASIVGEEDARQTPESVLTLVQPAMVMGAVDQGIGGLAQGAMAEPVQGAMAQGIMSTVEPPQPAMEAGGTPPVNFKDGGLVRRGDNQPVLKFENAGLVPFLGPRVGMTPRDSKALRQQIDMANLQNQLAAAQGAPTVRPLKEIFDETRGTYASLLGGQEKRAADLEEQKNLTQAQMLFDIANTALTFAAPMQGERPGMSAAE